MDRRHLTTAHGLTAVEYRPRWSLPRDHRENSSGLIGICRQ